jgi:hypothetical protein
LLSFLEDKMADRLTGRREDFEQLAVVIPTSVWFSSDKHLAVQATMQSFAALNYHLKQPPYTILEDLLLKDNRAQIGCPRLVIVPSATLLREAAWQFLLDMARDDGATVLVTGSVQQDEFWRRRERLAEIGVACETVNLATVERLRLGDRTHDCTFRKAIRCGMPAKGLLRAVSGNAAVCEPMTIGMGKGRMVYCPVPVELADDIEPTVELYKRVLSDADLPEPTVTVDIGNNSASQFIHAIDYGACTAISLVNEGADATLRFRLSLSSRDVEIEMAQGRAAKLYVNSEGELIGGYAHRPVRVGDFRILPGGDLAFVKKGARWQLLPGVRTGERCAIGSSEVETMAFVYAEVQ